MSRSTKAPFITDRDRHRKAAKRLSNKRLRRAVDVQGGNWFKKHSRLDYGECEYHSAYLPAYEKAYRK
jgi:hypothetical protein